VATDKIPNLLVNEKSPYLLQHAYNPVDWFPWSEEAFDKAKAEDKPIFLSIGYSTCHWCHKLKCSVQKKVFAIKQIKFETILKGTFTVPFFIKLQNHFICCKIELANICQQNITGVI
jgi:thioredoxin-related protein